MLELSNSGWPSKIDDGEIAPLHFSTRNLPPVEQFLAWRDMIEPFASYMSLRAIQDGYSADLTTWNLGNFALIRGRMAAAAFKRSARHLRTYPMDHWIIRSARRPPRGNGRRGLEDHEAFGSSTVWSLGTTFSGLHGDVDELYAFIPREFCTEAAAALDEAMGSGMEPGPGALLNDYLLSLEARLPDLKSADLASVQRATHAMITCCLRPSSENRGAALHPIDATLFERARQVINKQLLSPELGPEYLCAQLGVSRSRLYRIFSGVGGVAAYIRRRRLLNVHTALSNPRDHRYIAEIAAEHGFLDPAEFSRIFRREFDYRPKDVRHEMASTTYPHVVALHMTGSGSQGQHFLDLLKGLR